MSVTFYIRRNEEVMKKKSVEPAKKAEAVQVPVTEAPAKEKPEPAKGKGKGKGKSAESKADEPVNEISAEPVSEENETGE